MEMGLSIKLTEPAFLILPISYDRGWSIRSYPNGESFNVSQYDGLMEIQLHPGTYRLSLLYKLYQDSLNQTSVVFFAGAGLCIVSLWLTRFPSRKIRSDKARDSIKCSRVSSPLSFWIGRVCGTQWTLCGTLNCSSRLWSSEKSISN